MAFLWIMVLGPAAAVGLELLARAAVRRRTVAILADVIDTGDHPVDVALPSRPILPALSRGTVQRLDLGCSAISLEGLEVVDVHLVLTAVGLSATGRITRGQGVLTGRITAREVRRMAGIPGHLSLSPGAATVRWPAERLGLGVRVKPSFDGKRIRLLPTPLSMAIPPLPPGTTLTQVEAVHDALVVQAHIDLATLLVPVPALE